ncbi:Fic family protein [Nocardia uniformis]|uniref:Fic family protein n=1 Tax=Nocardia uniformis TaxID=53432 RepID=A0A849C6F9_9NOCA|nr:Fic family protein [Nocardia uniformis]NNH72000.1 Fic family protein [Nocardia uniformis]
MVNADRSAWPPVTYEERPWSVHEAYASRTQLRRHAGPYSAAVVPAIEGQPVRLSTALQTEVADAAHELVRFDAHVAAELGSDGEIGPMSAVLLRTESAASSQIENLTVGARQLALAELGEHTNRNARIVTANVRSMQAAVELSRSVDGDTILAMHRELLTESDAEHAGQWRSEQVWIGGGSVGPHLADFIPPHSDRVQEAIDDLILFVHRTDVPALAHIALAHAQFETIHPFTNGNGRTGRALVHAMLSGKGLTRHVTVPISAGLLVRTKSYFEALTAYRSGDPEPIVRQFVDATCYATGSGAELVSRLSATRMSYRERTTARSDSFVWRVIDTLVAQPVVNTTYVADRFGISGVAAQRAIDRLVDSGVLREASNRARNRVWQADEILGALDDFAAGIRRVRDR